MFVYSFLEATYIKFYLVLSSDRFDIASTSTRNCVRVHFAFIVYRVHLIRAEINSYRVDSRNNLGFTRDDKSE